MSTETRYGKPCMCDEGDPRCPHDAAVKAAGYGTRDLASDFAARVMEAAEYAQKRWHEADEHDDAFHAGEKQMCVEMLAVLLSMEHRKVRDYFKVGVF